MKQAAYNTRNWRELFVIILLGVMIGSGIGVAAKMLTPVMIWAKNAPIEAAKAKRKSLLPLGDPLGHKRTA
ncbi:MAG: hypothetical protein M3O00_18930 [Pseudomonadota bacterium]|nr:hypothetical protein [Pseudomonadota bacterium]